MKRIYNGAKGQVSKQGKRENVKSQKSKNRECERERERDCSVIADGTF